MLAFPNAASHLPPRNPEFYTPVDSRTPGSPFSPSAQPHILAGSLCQVPDLPKHAKRETVPFCLAHIVERDPCGGQDLGHPYSSWQVKMRRPRGRLRNAWRQLMEAEKKGLLCKQNTWVCYSPVANSCPACQERICLLLQAHRAVSVGKVGKGSGQFNKKHLLHHVLC